MYEVTSHHRIEEHGLEARRHAAFSEVAEAPNAAPATWRLIHEDGGRRTFIARFQNVEDARAFRAALGPDPAADARATPGPEGLRPEASEQVSGRWSEPAPPRAR